MFPKFYCRMPRYYSTGIMDAIKRTVLTRSYETLASPSSSDSSESPIPIFSSESSTNSSRLTSSADDIEGLDLLRRRQHLDALHPAGPAGLLLVEDGEELAVRPLQASVGALLLGVQGRVPLRDRVTLHPKYPCRVSKCHRCAGERSGGGGLSRVIDPPLKSSPVVGDVLWCYSGCCVCCGCGSCGCFLLLYGEL